MAVSQLKWAYWSMPVLPALGKQRPEDGCHIVEGHGDLNAFKASLDYRVSH